MSDELWRQVLGMETKYLNIQHSAILLNHGEEELWWGQIPGTYPVLLSEEDGLANGEFCLAWASEKKIKSFIWDKYSHRTGSSGCCYITTLTTTCYVIKRARLVHGCWSSTRSKAGLGDGDGDGGDGSNSLTPLQIGGLRQAPLKETIKTMLHNASRTNQALSCDTEFFLFFKTLLHPPNLM